MAGKSQASGGEQSSGEAGVASAGDTLGDPGKELSLASGEVKLKEQEAGEGLARMWMVNATDSMQIPFGTQYTVQSTQYTTLGR